MNSIFYRSAFLLSLLVLSACGNQLRKPFCKESLKQFPTEFQGQYQTTLPVQSAAWSGNLVLKPIAIDLSLQGATATVPSELLPSWGQICVVQGRYIVEKQNPNGTYSITEMSKSAVGLVFSALSIDLDRAQKAHYTLYYSPTQRFLSQDMSSQIRPATFILDNSNLSPEQVLAVSKPIFLQMVLSPASPETRLRSDRLKASYRFGTTGIVRN